MVRPWQQDSSMAVRGSRFWNKPLAGSRVPSQLPVDSGPRPCATYQASKTRVPICRRRMATPWSTVKNSKPIFARLLSSQAGGSVSPGSWNWPCMRRAWGITVPGPQSWAKRATLLPPRKFLPCFRAVWPARSVRPWSKSAAAMCWNWEPVPVSWRRIFSGKWPGRIVFPVST